jgi:hypothetical protein
MTFTHYKFTKRQWSTYELNKFTKRGLSFYLGFKNALVGRIHFPYLFGEGKDNWTEYGMYDPS